MVDSAIRTNGDAAMPEDAYQTIVAEQETEIKILASRFLSYAFPCASAADFQQRLDGLRKQHYNATHHCYAWRLGMVGDTFRYNDDGEPAGTAGKRILSSIDRLQLTDLGIVVVRYFGGTKLGVGGLSRAYSDAADAVLALCAIERRFLTTTIALSFPYDMTSQVHHAIERHEAEILDRGWSEHAEYRVRLRRSRAEVFLVDVAELTQRQAVARRDDEMA